MYKIVEKLENVDSFKASDKYLGFKLKENKRSLYLNGNIIDEDNRGYFFYENSLCLQNGAKTTFLNLQTKERIEIPITFNGDNGHFENTYISSINSKQEDDFRWTSNYVMYQISPFKKLYELPHRYYGSGYRFKNQYIQIQNESKALKSLSLLTGSYEWEVDLEEKLGTYDGISKIYGLVNECLWSVTQRGVLLGININDGTLIHHLNFDGYDTFQQYGTVQMQYFRSLFDEKQQILVGLYENRYWEIDLKADKPALQMTDIKVLNPSYFNNPSFIYEVYHLAAPEGIAYDEHYIYFKDNEISTVGVLNRQTKQIEWHDKLYELPGRSYVMIRDIQVAANKMYVLDEKGVLHIYERE